MLNPSQHAFKTRLELFDQNKKLLFNVNF